MESKKTGLAAPWVIWANQVEAFFKEDTNVKVEYDDNEKVITLRVFDQEKADALTKLLPGEKTFGNVSVKVKIIPANEECDDNITLFEKALKGHPVVSRIINTETLWGTVNFVMFNPKVVQYYSDEFFDLNGVTTTVYQDLAKEVFDSKDGIFFCTEKIEN